MTSACSMIEGRRSSRVIARIPVTVFPDPPDDFQLETRTAATAISRDGAPLRIPFSPVLGSRLEI